MIIKHTVQQGVDVAELHGQLNIANAAEARAALGALIEEGRRKLVLDFSGVDFVDSSGLSVLVSTYKLIAARDGSMVLSHIPQPVQSLLALTRLNMVFQIFVSTEAAIEFLGQDG